jgi:hypothetical protein
LRNKRAGSKQNDAFDAGLRDRNTVEGVFMKCRQAAGSKGMLTVDRQYAISIVDQAPTKQARIHTKIATSESVLDCHFPQAGRAEQ